MEIRKFYELKRNMQRADIKSAPTVFIVNIQNNIITHYALRITHYFFVIFVP